MSQNLTFKPLNSRFSKEINMNDKTFMNMLDTISKKGNKPNIYAQFLTTLFKGYQENLGLLGLYNNANGTDLLLFAGTLEKKSLLFFTQKNYYFQFKKSMMPSMQSDTNCRLFSCREIINSILDDSTIEGIIFNVGMENRLDLHRSFLEESKKNGLFVRLSST